jgi:hypothetical protein
LRHIITGLSREQVKTVVNNVIVGQLWLDNYGVMEIRNETTGDKCILDFKRRYSRPCHNTAL